MDALDYLHPRARPRDRQALPHARRRRLLHQGPRHRRHRPYRTWQSQGRRRRRNRRPRPTPARPSSPASKCSTRPSTKARRRQRRPACCAASKRNRLERGQVLAKPGSITPHTKFEGEIYVLTKEEGGRHTPFFTGYRPQFYFRTTDVTGAVKPPAAAPKCACPATTCRWKSTWARPDRHGRRRPLRHSRRRPYRRRRRRDQDYRVVSPHTGLRACGIGG